MLISFDNRFLTHSSLDFLVEKNVFTIRDNKLSDISDFRVMSDEKVGATWRKFSVT